VTCRPQDVEPSLWQVTAIATLVNPLCNVVIVRTLFQAYVDTAWATCTFPARFCRGSSPWQLVAPYPPPILYTDRSCQ
jgi:hypothetical protein